MKLDYLPEKQGYSFVEGAFRSFMGSLGGPLPTIGKGIVRTAYVVSVMYHVPKEEFDTFMEFVDAHQWGAVFQADLILEDGHLEECQCQFVQESISISNKGNAYYVSAKLNAMRM